MSSYALVESLRYPLKDYKFQTAVKPMAEQVVTVDKSYGYEALTHGHQKSNESGYFTVQTGYGNDKRNIGYDAGCARGKMVRDILGRVRIIDPAVGPKSQDCGCTKYKKRNCTGTMGNIPCGAEAGACPKNNPVCCHAGDMCSSRLIGDQGSCIAGKPYPY